MLAILKARDCSDPNIVDQYIVSGCSSKSGVGHTRTFKRWFPGISQSLGTRQLCSYFYLLCCSKIYLLCLNLCSILTYYAQIMPNYLCLSSHARPIISNLWINNNWLKHKLSQNTYHRKDRYTLIVGMSNRFLKV